MVQCGDQIRALLCPIGSLRVKERLCAKLRVKGMQQFECEREVRNMGWDTKWKSVLDGGSYRDGEGSLEYDKSLKTREERSKVNFNFEKSCKLISDKG